MALGLCAAKVGIDGLEIAVGNRVDHGEWENALFILTSVMSHAKADKAICDAGLKAQVTMVSTAPMSPDAFYAAFYCAAVTRCYPGRPASGRGDRTPSLREQQLCAFWREEELRLLGPELIVTVGGLALRRLLGLPALTEAIGKSFVLGSAIVIPLPHPSGASGWLNDRANRARLGKAATHVRRELARLAEARPPLAR